MRSIRAGLLLGGLLAGAWASAVPASAQTSYERFSLDTTVALDLFRGDNVSDRPQVIVDIIGTVRLGDRWQVYVRPWFRLPRPSPPTAPPPEWDTQLYQASLRYERPGAIATRVDAGYIASPVGLGLFDANPSVNPTISGHTSYFTPMLPFDAGGPRGPAVASTYPLGAVLTLSATRWDARAAVVNSAPVRSWILGAASNPVSTPVFEAGAGITPTTGLRLGVSFAHGAFLKDEELNANAVRGDRTVTLIGFEGDYAVRYTKVTGEFVHDSFVIPGLDAPAIHVVHPGHSDASARAGRSAAATRARTPRSPATAPSSARSPGCSPTSSPPGTASHAKSRSKPATTPASPTDGRPGTSREGFRLFGKNDGGSPAQGALTEKNGNVLRVPGTCNVLWCENRATCSRARFSTLETVGVDAL